MSKLGQHVVYVYASFSRLDFHDSFRNIHIVFSGIKDFATAKKPVALTTHWRQGGHGGV